MCRVFTPNAPLTDTPLTHQESLSEVEEKYKKAMVSNAQLDNDKANLIYQVDTLKDVIEEMEEQMAEMKRELEEKSKVSSMQIKKKYNFFLWECVWESGQPYIDLFWTGI